MPRSCGKQATRPEQRIYSAEQRTDPAEAWLRRPLKGSIGELGTAVWLLGCSLVAAALQLTPALAQEGPNAAAALGQDASDPDQDPGPEGDVLNVQRLLQILYQVKTSPGTDLNGNPVTTTTDTWKLRWDSTYMLSSQWWLVLRGDLPYLAKDKYTDSNPNGDFLYGLGDADIQAALIDNINARWKAGAGARLIAPTGDAALGSGKWQIMPIAGVRYALPEISSGSYVEPLMRYDVSFAGDPTRRSISNLQVAPMLNISLPRDPLELRRSDHRPDGTSVPAVRRANGTQIQRQFQCVAQGRGSDRQAISGLRFHDRAEVQFDVLIRLSQKADGLRRLGLLERIPIA